MFRVGAGGDELEEGRRIRTDALVQQINNFLELSLSSEGHEVDGARRRGCNRGRDVGHRGMASEGSRRIVKW